jgi:hypothetical protein
MKKNILMFDVESTSLHGEGFAVGAVVYDENNIIIDTFALMSTDVAEKANEWVKENVLPHLNKMPKCKTGLELRDAFYGFYLKHKNTCEIWSDCNFPVETNFLSAVVADNIAREFEMPYPLYDVCNFVPVQVDRANECRVSCLQKHNPCHDAMASMACLIKSDSYKKFKNEI